MRTLLTMADKIALAQAAGINRLSHLIVILTVHEDGPRSMSWLASCAKISTAAMTGAIDKIVRLGYVERDYTRDTHDRRSIMVKLTDAGRELAEDLA